MSVSGIVDQNVDPSEPRLRRIDSCIDRIAIGNVEGDRMEPFGVTGQRIVDLSRLARRGHDIVASLEGRARNFEA